MTPSQGKTDRAPLAILLLATALRLYRLDFQSLWWDEGHSISVARAALTQIPTLPAMDVHPPLYFQFLHLWMNSAGSTEFAARYLSLIFGVLAVALLYRLGRDGGERALGWLAAILGALSPFLVAYSQEVRMYSLVACLSLLSVLSFLRAARGRSNAPWVVYSVSSALSLYTHYFSAFLLVFQNLLLAGLAVIRPLWRTRKHLLRWLGSQLGILVMFAPLAYWAAQQVVSYRNVNLSPPSPALYLESLWRAFNLGPAHPPEGSLPLLAVTGAILLVGLGLWATRSQDLKQRILLTACLMWIAIPLAVYWLVLQERPSFHPRYLIIVAPAYILLMGMALHGAWRRLPVAGALLTLMAAAVFVLGLGSHYFDENTYNDDTRGLAQFLLSEAGDQDIVFIDVPHPLDYYYPPAHYLFVDIHTTDRTLSELCQGKGRIFFIRWRGSDTDPRGFVPFLLDKYCHPLGQRGFRGYDVVWYQLPPNPHFALAEAFEAGPMLWTDGLQVSSYAYGGSGQGPTNSEAEVNRKVVPSGRSIWAALRWLPRDVPLADYKASLVVKDPWGNPVGQADKMLLNDAHLYSSHWQAGEEAINVYNVPIAPGSPPGTYTLEVSLYDPSDMSPLDLLDAAGAPIGTTADLGTLKVERPMNPPALDSLGIPRSLEVPLSQDLTLLGYDLPVPEVSPGQALAFNLYWRAERDVSEDYLIRVRLQEESGAYLIQAEDAPAHGSYPTHLWVSGEIVRDSHSLALPAQAPQGRYSLQVELVDSADNAVKGSATLDAIQVAGRAHQFEVPIMSQSVNATLGDSIRLLGYDLEPQDPVSPGATLQLTLYWQAIGELETSYTVFTHLLDGSNVIRGQRDSIPGQGTLPTTSWLESEIITDVYQIPVATDTPAGELTLEVGMYDAATGNRLVVVDAQGQPQPGDRILLHSIRVEAN